EFQSNAVCITSLLQKPWKFLPATSLISSPDYSSWIQVSQPDAAAPAGKAFPLPAAATPATAPQAAAFRECYPAAAGSIANPHAWKSPARRAATPDRAGTAPLHQSATGRACLPVPGPTAAPRGIPRDRRPDNRDAP